MTIFKIREFHMDHLASKLRCQLCGRFINLKEVFYIQPYPYQNGLNQNEIRRVCDTCHQKYNELAKEEGMPYLFILRNYKRDTGIILQAGAVKQGPSCATLAPASGPG